MAITGLSRAFVYSYLPYKKIPYNLNALFVNTEWGKLCRERKRRCGSRTKEVGDLWGILFTSCVHKDRGNKSED